jgi:hypothetical protein
VKALVVPLILSISALAGTGKILDVSPYNEHGATQVTVIQGYPNPIVTQGSWEMFTLTIALDGFAYSANFRAKRGFHSTDLIVGDPIMVVVEGNKLLITRSDGKTEKAKIVRKARI